MTRLARQHFAVSLARLALFWRERDEDEPYRAACRQRAEWAQEFARSHRRPAQQKPYRRPRCAACGHILKLLTKGNDK